MPDLRKHSSTSNLIRFTLKNSSTGVGLTGLSSASSGLIISTICDNEATATVYTVTAANIETITTLGTYAAPTASKCRFKEVDATNHKGLYEFQFADARFAVASAKRLVISVTGATSLLDADYEIQLLSFDPYVAIAQTGDSFARLGAPAGASVSADVAGVQADTDNIQTRIPAALTAGGNIKADTLAVAGTAQTGGDLAAMITVVDDFVDTEVTAIKTKTDFLPSATAGASGGLFIAGANAATSVTTALTANITGNLSGSVGSVTGAVGSVTGAVGSVTGLTVSNLDVAVSTRATPAQVNTEVVDALNVDTYSEPGQESPGVTVSLAKKIGYLYKAFRNKITQDATTAKLYADDGTTVDQKATVSDDATTYTRGEMGTGP